MRQQLCKISCVVMAVVFPVSSLMAENPTANAQTGGNVTINGKAVSGSSSIFNGDRIQTSGSGSAVSIVANGTTVMVMGNSSVTYAQDNLTDLCGGVLIGTKVAHHINGVAVTPSPAGSSSRYEFRQSRGSYQIVTREGSVAYNDGTGEKTLGTNQSANLSGGGEGCGVAAATTPTAQGPAPVQGGVSGGALPSGIVLAAAAGGAAAIGLGIYLFNRHHRNVSPSVP